MSFEAVVFGTYVIGTGYTQGDSIPKGGYQPYIVITNEVGSNAFDVSITYVDQHGNTDTTVVSTAVSAYTQAGTYVKMVLKNGDSGVREITAVTVTGGTAGDAFTLESYNEGLGGPLSLESSATGVVNNAMIGAREFSSFLLLENESTNALQFLQNVSLSNVTYNGSNFVLETEEIEPSYEGMDEDDGFFEVNTTVSNANHMIQMYVKSETSYEYVDPDYMSHSFIYDGGFYEIEFDYDVQLNSTYFIFELLDSDGNVKWSKNGTTSGSNQKVTFVSDEFWFRIRCKADYTTPVGYTDYAEVSNITIRRYKTSGYVEQTVFKYREFMKELKKVHVGGTIATSTELKAHIDVGDSPTVTTGFVGPDGTSATYHDLVGHDTIYLNGAAGKYWKTKVYLTSNGKYTPTFDYIKYYFDMWLNLEEIPLEVDAGVTQVVPVAFHPLGIEISKANPVNTPLVNGREFAAEDVYLALISSQANPVNNGLVGVREHRMLYDKFDAGDFVYGAILEDVVYDASTFKLDPEEVEPSYSTEIEGDSGFLDCTPTIDAGNKTLKVDLNAATFYDAIDGEYQRYSFIYDEAGFTQIEFDYDVVLHSTYFILELVDSNGTVKWSKNSTASGTGQVVAMASTSWEFRVRCKADYTSPAAPWDNHAYISNIKLTRYPLTGKIEMPYYLWREHTISMNLFELSMTDATGCNIEAQVYISDEQDGSPNTGWIGPDGTSATYYQPGFTVMDTNGYSGKYYKLKILFESDGRYTPTFHYIKVLQYVDMYLRNLPVKSSWSESTVGTVMSGYCRDQNDDVILNGVKVILESTYVFGRDTMGAVNPETGFYQVFVKEAKYDLRHLIMKVDGKTTNLSLSGYGTPAELDATVGDIPNQDIHFWKAPLCKSVAHVDSLVTY